MPKACNIPPHLFAFCGSAQPQSGPAVPTPVARGDKAGRPCRPPLEIRPNIEQGALPGGALEQGALPGCAASFKVEVHLKEEDRTGSRGWSSASYA